MSAESKPTLLLADLHLPVAALHPEASFLNEAFFRFCAGPARQAAQVLLLGDLFETWIGDDLGVDAYAAECAALRQLHDGGVRLRYQTGNRDFLLGRGFETATGAERLADEHVELLAGKPTLLAHGDQYCTDDVGYQRWRRFSHNRLAQRLFLLLPASRRRRIAGGVQGSSRAAKRGKPVGIMDVNPDAIDRAIRLHAVQRLVHGHTHRPATHRPVVDGVTRERIVLADWRPGRFEWLRADASGLHRETFSDMV